MNEIKKREMVINYLEDQVDAGMNILDKYIIEYLIGEIGSQKAQLKWIKENQGKEYAFKATLETSNQYGPVDIEIKAIDDMLEGKNESL